VHDELHIITDKPSDFIVLNTYLPNVKVQLAYCTDQNFTGMKVDGYYDHISYYEKTAAKALLNANKKFNEDGFGIIIYDSFRPLKAIKFFKNWAMDAKYSGRKELFPDLEKEQLFIEGYINPHSSHARGSAIDMSLYELMSGKILDMGTEFDFFGKESHTESNLVSDEIRKRRMYLKTVMDDHGFLNFYQEWWHFRFKEEKYPTTFFDFDIKA
jgi:D-alanyl-D-alanine dipeptidase